MVERSDSNSPGVSDRTVQTAASRTSTLLSRLAFLGCWLLLPLLNAAEQPRSASEYDIKAVFLYNFTKFTDWPENAFPSTNSPIIIAVAGQDPFGKALDEVMKGEAVRRHPLQVQRLNGGAPIPHCHILFIARSEKDRLDSLLKEVQGRPILTVADTPRAAERGVMVNLVVQESVRMEINQAAIAAARLQVSSKLLSLARIVQAASPPAAFSQP